MKNIFRALIELRNYVYGIDLDFAENNEKNGLWVLKFITRPVEAFLVFIKMKPLDVAKEKDTNFYQLILNLNRKGIDYSSGGAFVEIVVIDI